MNPRANSWKPATIRWHFIFSLLLLLLGACGQDTPSQPTGESTAGEDLSASSEQLWAAPPAGWETGHSVQTPEFRRAEFGPPGQSTDPLHGPREQFIVEVMVMDPSLDSIYFIDQLAAEQAASCERFKDAPTFSGLENGYPTTVRLLTCGRHKVEGIGRVTLIKTIQGNDFFYVIAREKEAKSDPAHPAASADDLAAWALHLKTVRVCSSSDPQHPCPASGNRDSQDS